MAGGSTAPSAPPAFKLNPYVKDLNLAIKEDEKRYNHAIEAKRSDQIYDVTSTNFETFVSRVNIKVHKYMLNRNNNASSLLIRNSTAIQVLITTCYGETKMEDLGTKAENVWLDSNEDIASDADTTRKHMAYQVLANLLTEDEMADITLTELEYMIGVYDWSIS